VGLCFAINSNIGFVRVGENYPLVLIPK
jgi:hypothetical protein